MTQHNSTQRNAQLRATGDIQVATRAIDTLLPYARNARTHSQQQVKQIARSIARFGFCNPVLVGGDGTIIAGHGRILAAKQLGLTEVPVIVLAHLSEVERRSLCLADNKIAENAGWNEQLLALELRDLKSIDADLDALGFDWDELERLLQFDPEAIRVEREENIPDPPRVPVSQLGDLWLLGKHRLICGDSTNTQTVERLFAGDVPNLMVTDPPYGVEYDPNWRNDADRMNGQAIGARAVGRVSNDHRVDWRQTWALFPGAVAYIWHAGRHASEAQASVEAVDFEIRSQIIWAKARFAISRGHYHWQHEPCWYAVRRSRKSNWQGNRSQSTLWTIAHSKNDTGHGTQKPVECMRRPIINHTDPDQAVYDPFIGSGTTIIAAESTRRRAFGIEIDPLYVDVAVRRWQEFAGGTAVLEETGETFAEVAARRLGNTSK